jgi:hypothetical protein
MTPEEIESKFGKEALRRLYDSALNNPVHDLVNRIFHYKTEQEIAEWLAFLDEINAEWDAEDEEANKC